MRRMFLRRRWPAALVLGLYWFSLTASVAGAPPDASLPAGSPLAQAVSVASPPVRCLGTLFYARAETLQLSGWPKIIVSVDVTRADRCAGSVTDCTRRRFRFEPSREVG